MLLELLNRGEVNSAIVFTRTKSRADRVARMLVGNRVKAVAIHGGRSQNQRNAALGFRNGHYKVLVATDVAARGLDVPHVSHVVNFDLPQESETYIHRIGRTARMGRSGQALSLVMPEEVASLRGIERMLGVRLQRASIAGFQAPELTVHKQGTTGPPVTRYSPVRSWHRDTDFSARKMRISSRER